MPLLELNIPTIDVPLLFFTSITIIVLIVIIGIATWQNNNRRMVIQIRKNWDVLMVMLLILLPLPFINNTANWETLMLWCIPASPFMAYAFSETKSNFFPNVLFWCLMIIGVISNWNIINLIKY